MHEMGLIFFPENHRYELDGVEVPSVTTITRFASYDSADGAMAWLRDMAANRGRRVHEYCQRIDEDPETQVETADLDCDGFVDAYRIFLRDYRIKGWDAVEKPLASVYGFAGTLDRMGWIDGHLTIVDIKTSGKLNKLACGAQLNGYHALARENGYDVDALAILQLTKFGEYRYVPFEVSNDVFISCLNLHTTTEKLQRKRRSA